jgi:CheY-like chemotaxis protein
MGFTADVVNDGRQCLEKLTLADYDLVLMDIAMPVVRTLLCRHFSRSPPLTRAAQMNGLEASRYIMEHWSDARRPMIVAVTANSMANADEYRAAGMDRAIFKPITMAKIADVLRDAIRKARQRSPLRRFSV